MSSLMGETALLPKKSVRGKKWLDMFSQAKRTESENVFFFFLRLIQ